jgi:hypothetical protein
MQRLQILWEAVGAVLLDPAHQRAHARGSHLFRGRAGVGRCCLEFAVASSRRPSTWAVLAAGLWGSGPLAASATHGSRRFSQLQWSVPRRHFSRRPPSLGGRLRLLSSQTCNGCCGMWLAIESGRFEGCVPQCRAATSVITCGFINGSPSTTDGVHPLLMARGQRCVSLQALSLTIVQPRSGMVLSLKFRVGGGLCRPKQGLGCSAV